MSYDIGFVSGNLQPDDEEWMAPEELLAIRPSLAGHPLLSAETTPDTDRSNAILALATLDASRFRSLVDLLPPLIADIFYQYYFLGRTYSQIGRLLFPGIKSPQQFVRDGNRLGERALAAIILHDGDLDSVAKHPAWIAASSWRIDPHRRTVRIRGHRDLGRFHVVPNGQLSELFAPSWSVLGPWGQWRPQC